VLSPASTGTVSADSIVAYPLTFTTSVHYVYADHINTPRVITRASDNQMVWRWDNTDPFGVTQPNTNPAGLGAFTYNPRFPGQVYDAETGLHYNYHRHYDSATGRYTTSDPIGLEGGLNTYAYVNGNPVNFIDPLGLYQMCHRDLQLPLPYARHCYIKYDDGTSSSYDPNGVRPDPDPNQEGTMCTAPKEPEKDDCIKKAMKQCEGKDYSFTKFNCCHCAEQAMKECGASIPPSKWPNWPINPGPQQGEPGYSPLPKYNSDLGKLN
jgi:RHS repeat-associated protein